MTFAVRVLIYVDGFICTFRVQRRLFTQLLYYLGVIWSLLAKGYKYSNMFRSYWLKATCFILVYIEYHTQNPNSWTRTNVQHLIKDMSRSSRDWKFHKFPNYLLKTTESWSSNKGVGCVGMVHRASIEHDTSLVVHCSRCSSRNYSYKLFDA